MAQLAQLFVDTGLLLLSAHNAGYQRGGESILYSAPAVGFHKYLHSYPFVWGKAVTTMTGTEQDPTANLSVTGQPLYQGATDAPRYQENCIDRKREEIMLLKNPETKNYWPCYCFYDLYFHSLCAKFKIVFTSWLRCIYQDFYGAFFFVLFF